MDKTESKKNKLKISRLSVVHPKVKMGLGVRIYGFVNIYGPAEIGDKCVIGAFVEIQPGVKIGDKVKISSHAFICTGVTIDDEAFIGHGVMFINDKYPRSVDNLGCVVDASDTKVILTRVKRKAMIGTNSTILCGVTIGEGAVVGAGSVVTKDVEPHTVVCGNPARLLKKYNG